MSELTAFIADAQAQMAELIRSAYEEGREAGRIEATRELKNKLFGVLNDGGSKLPTAATADELAREQRIDDLAEYAATGVRPQPRAAPGSVKPIIMKMLSETQDGLDPQEVAHQTDIKFNSIRGTLYTLSQEGFAQRRDGRWFLATKIEASSVEPEGAPLEASHVPPEEPVEPEGAALRSVEPVPGGGT